MKLGILGGGQLARMLILEGHRLGLKMSVLCSSAQEPAAQVCADFQIGALDDTAALKKFFAPLDHVTAESEFLNIPFVKSALGPKAFDPRPDLLTTLQDRLTQKNLLLDFGIPTAPFRSWDHEVPVGDFFLDFPHGFVIKKRRFGYDGYGTFVFHKKKMAATPKHDDFGYIAEAFVPFRRELAFSLARNADGEFSIFPLVETHQVDSRCLWVKGPVQHRGFPALVRKFKKLLNQLDYRGILAVELFENKNRLLVNELAPRVHNSAHYSTDALDLNQFEAQLRGILNWPLKNPKPLSRGFAMVNLLGEGQQKIQFSREPVGQLHWYGKTDNRRLRKLGHLNVTGRSPNEALARALKWRKEFIL